MPPFGADEQVQAIHILNVLDCAKSLVASISQVGGIDKIVIAQPAVAAALKQLCEQAGKLQVYEVRARARGTIKALDDESLTMAIKDVRDKRQLTADEEDVRDATKEQTDALFSLDDDGTEDPPKALPPAQADEPAPASGPRDADDAFSL